MITWDEAKRRKNLKDHGIDLAKIADVFDSPMITVEDTRERYGEHRLQSLGWFAERVVFLVWTERDDGARVIPAAMVTNMKRASTSKPLAFSKKQMKAAIAAAPDKVNDPTCPYDPNDATAVKEFWAKGEVRLPGQRGPQKNPTKIAVTVRYSPEVLEYFRSTGEGWQTRMNDALRAYVKRHRAV